MLAAAVHLPNSNIASISINCQRNSHPTTLQFDVKENYYVNIKICMP